MLFLEECLKELFVDFHKSGLWDDEKSISDSVLLAPAQEILASYRALKQQGAVDLMAFHAQYFRPVQMPDQGFTTDPTHGPLQHLDRIWSKLLREADAPDHPSSRIPLDHPYVVVGGRYQEVYYWDSYFTQLGLLRVGRHVAVRQMLDNFAGMIQRFGFIPNGSRTYYLTRSQPPFFSMMVRDYGTSIGDASSVYAEYRDAMEREYLHFVGSQRNHLDLMRYWDNADSPRIEMYGTDLAWSDRVGEMSGKFRDLRAACESGWDFSSRWLNDPGDLASIETTNIWPVDLNCILVVLEKTLAEAFADMPEKSAAFAQSAEERSARISRRMFDDDRGYFFDIRISSQTFGNVSSAAGLYPLWAGVATTEQAVRSVQHMEATLLHAGGIATTNIQSGQQWDFPNGWAPLQWIAIQGLRKYGFDALADEVKRRWLETCDSMFRREGKFVEKYNVVAPGEPSGGGEYELQDGFGWSNGVYLDLVLEDRAR